MDQVSEQNETGKSINENNDKSNEIVNGITNELITESLRSPKKHWVSNHNCQEGLTEIGDQRRFHK